jgi:hypothetical protein
MSGTNVMKQVATLRTTIDQLDSNFKKAKDQILELARTLDESKECQRNHISRKIKELLQDKIKEGKISSKWIHDYLPSEYKREYKREVSSLSAADSNEEDSTHLASRHDGTALLQEVSNGSGPNNSHPKQTYENWKQQAQFQVNENHNSSLPPGESEEEAPFTVDFEFCLPFEEVRRYMESIFRENRCLDKVYFHGTLDIQTGKVIHVCTGTADNP